MGSIQRTTTATKFERTLRQCLLNPEEKIFLFDQAWIDRYGGISLSVVTRLAGSCDSPLYKFSGSTMTTEILLNLLCGDSVHDSNQETPDYRHLMEAINKGRRGIFLIDTANGIDEDVVQLLEMLVVFVKRHRLKWNFVLVADIDKDLELMTVQYCVDRVFQIKKTQSGSRLRTTIDVISEIDLDDYRKYFRNG